MLFDMEAFQLLKNRYCFQLNTYKNLSFVENHLINCHLRIVTFKGFVSAFYDMIIHTNFL